MGQPLAPYEYEASVHYIAGYPTAQTSVHPFGPRHWQTMPYGAPTPPPQPHQDGVYVLGAPGVPKIRIPVAGASSQQIPSNTSVQYIGLKAPRLPTQGDPRLTF